VFEELLVEKAGVDARGELGEGDDAGRAAVEHLDQRRHDLRGEVVAQQLQQPEILRAREPAARGLSAARHRSVRGREVVDEGLPAALGEPDVAEGPHHLRAPLQRVRQVVVNELERLLGPVFQQ
jgi:hypothetical protein